LKGEGIFELDGKQFPISEGSIVRIAPEGKRAFKNTGNEEMLMLCVQYKANTFTDSDEPMNDGIMLESNVKL
jgi:mannose-6-phosphate isomerase-like protein (cupin superfamily)